MATIAPTIPTIGDPNSSEDADIRAALITIRDAINGGLDNDNIAAAANIVYSKLSLSNSILNADIASAAAIAYSKLNVTGSIADADIASSANIFIGDAGTSFPGSPANNDIYVYNADTTNGVKWIFQYRSASASSYKWEFIGGPPLFAEVTTEQSTTSSSYTDLTTSGPSIALPLAGDYDVQIGTKTFNVSSSITFMSYAVGGTAASNTDAIESGSAAGEANAGTRMRRKTALGAVTLASKYKTGSGTAFFMNRWMKVTPVRI